MSAVFEHQSILYKLLETAARRYEQLWPGGVIPEYRLAAFYDLFERLKHTASKILGQMPLGEDEDSTLLAAAREHNSMGATVALALREELERVHLEDERLQSIFTDFCDTIPMFYDNEIYYPSDSIHAALSHDGKLLDSVGAETKEKLLIAQQTYLHISHWYLHTYCSTTLATSSSDELNYLAQIEDDGFLDALIEKGGADPYHMLHGIQKRDLSKKKKKREQLAGHGIDLRDASAAALKKAYRDYVNTYLDVIVSLPDAARARLPQYHVLDLEGMTHQQIMQRLNNVGVDADESAAQLRRDALVRGSNYFIGDARGNTLSGSEFQARLQTILEAAGSTDATLAQRQLYNSCHQGGASESLTQVLQFPHAAHPLHRFSYKMGDDKHILYFQGAQASTHLHADQQTDYHRISSRILCPSSYSAVSLKDNVTRPYTIFTSPTLIQLRSDVLLDGNSGASSLQGAKLAVVGRPPVEFVYGLESHLPKYIRGETLLPYEQEQIKVAAEKVCENIEEFNREDFVSWELGGSGAYPDSCDYEPEYDAEQGKVQPSVFWPLYYAYKHPDISARALAERGSNFREAFLCLPGSPEFMYRRWQTRPQLFSKDLWISSYYHVGKSLAENDLAGLLELVSADDRASVSSASTDVEPVPVVAQAIALTAAGLNRVLQLLAQAENPESEAIIDFFTQVLTEPCLQSQMQDCLALALQDSVQRIGLEWENVSEQQRGVLALRQLLLSPTLRKLCYTCFVKGSSRDDLDNKFSLAMLLTIKDHTIKEFNFPKFLADLVRRAKHQHGATARGHKLDFSGDVRVLDGKASKDLEMFSRRLEALPPLQQALHTDPDERVALYQILEHDHPYLKSYYDARVAHGEPLPVSELKKLLKQDSKLKDFHDTCYSEGKANAQDKLTRLLLQSPHLLPQYESEGVFAEGVLTPAHYGHLFVCGAQKVRDKIFANDELLLPMLRGWGRYHGLPSFLADNSPKGRRRSYLAQLAKRCLSEPAVLEACMASPALINRLLQYNPGDEKRRLLREAVEARLSTLSNHDYRQLFIETGSERLRLAIIRREISARESRSVKPRLFSSKQTMLPENGSKRLAVSVNRVLDMLSVLPDKPDSHRLIMKMQRVFDAGVDLQILRHGDAEKLWLLMTNSRNPAAKHLRQLMLMQPSSGEVPGFLRVGCGSYDRVWPLVSLMCDDLLDGGVKDFQRAGFIHHLFSPHYHGCLDLRHLLENEVLTTSRGVRPKAVERLGVLTNVILNGGDLSVAAKHAIAKVVSKRMGFERKQIYAQLSPQALARLGLILAEEHKDAADEIMSRPRFVLPGQSTSPLGILLDCAHPAAAKAEELASLFILKASKFRSAMLSYSWGNVVDSDKVFDKLLGQEASDMPKPDTLIKLYRCMLDHQSSMSARRSDWKSQLTNTLMGCVNQVQDNQLLCWLLCTHPNMMALLSPTRVARLVGDLPAADLAALFKRGGTLWEVEEQRELVASSTMAWLGLSWLLDLLKRKTWQVAGTSVTPVATMKNSAVGFGVSLTKGVDTTGYATENTEPFRSTLLRSSRVRQDNLLQEAIVQWFIGKGPAAASPIISLDDIEEVEQLSGLLQVVNLADQSHSSAVKKANRWIWENRVAVKAKLESVGEILTGLGDFAALLPEQKLKDLPLTVRLNLMLKPPQALSPAEVLQLRKHIINTLENSQDNSKVLKAFVETADIDLSWLKRDQLGKHYRRQLSQLLSISRADLSATLEFMRDEYTKEQQASDEGSSSSLEDDSDADPQSEDSSHSTRNWTSYSGGSRHRLHHRNQTPRRKREQMSKEKQHVQRVLMRASQAR